MAHTHEIQDKDTIFVIDPETRNISSSSSKIVLIQNDHNSEIFTFSIPRFVEGHDMNLCNKIEVHYTNLNKRTREESSDIYPVTDQKVEEDNLIFTWLISGNATKYPGTLSFSIKFGCIEEDSTYSYIWHTAIFRNVTISDGITNTELVEEKYYDVLENWKNQLIKLGTDAMTLGLQSATVGQIARIKAVDDNGKPTEWEAVDLPSGGGGGSTQNTLQIVDISDEVVDGVFDFITHGQGLYFSSNDIDFHYLRWDEKHEKYTLVSINISGLFIVSYSSNNGWFVKSVSSGITFVQISDTPIVEGRYDEAYLTVEQPM